MDRVTRIKSDFSNRRFLPRIGKIRLGIKKLSSKTGKEFPSDVDYFVCPPEVQAIYGEKPTELLVMLPDDDPTVVFPQRLQMWQAGGLYCEGDMEKALRRQPDGSKKGITCPCPFLKTEQNPKGECDERASLMVVLPRVNMGACYQIDTGSAFGVTNINSTLDYVKNMVGRIAWVPLLLRRIPQKMSHGGVSMTKSIVTLILDADIATVNMLRESTKRILDSGRYQIEGPKDTPPSQEPVDEVVDEEPPSEEPIRLKVIMQPDGAIREAQAALPPVHPTVEAAKQKMLHPEPPTVDTKGRPAPPVGAQDDLYTLPEANAAAGAGRAVMDENGWQAWHKRIQEYPAVYVEARRRMGFLNDKAPVSRGARERFRVVCETVAAEQKVAL